MTRLARQMIARAQQGDMNGPAGFDKMPGGDEAIAAVVIRPHRTITGRAVQRRSISRATAPPALSIISMAGLPAAIVKRSASAIWRTLSNAVWPFIISVQHFQSKPTGPIGADRSFRDGPLRLVYECCFRFLRRKGFRFLVVRFGPDEVEDHAARHLAVLEPIEDFVDR